MSFVSLCVCACFCHCFCVFLCVCLCVFVCFSVGFCLFLCVSVCLWLPCVKQEQMHFVLHLHKDSPNPYIYRCKFLPRLNHVMFLEFSGKTRVK